MCCGRSEAEIARRAEAIGRSVERLRADGLCGTPEEIANRIREFAKVGAERVFLQVLDIDDLDHLDVLSSVLPLLADSA